jgi:hypothetical protein
MELRTCNGVAERLKAIVRVRGVRPRTLSSAQRRAAAGDDMRIVLNTRLLTPCSSHSHATMRSSLGSSSHPPACLTECSCLLVALVSPLTRRDSLCTRTSPASGLAALSAGARSASWFVYLVSVCLMATRTGACERLLTLFGIQRERRATMIDQRSGL